MGGGTWALIRRNVCRPAAVDKSLRGERSRTAVKTNYRTSTWWWRRFFKCGAAAEEKRTVRSYCIMYKCKHREVSVPCHRDEVQAAPQLQVLTPQYDPFVTRLAAMRCSGLQACLLYLSNKQQSLGDLCSPFCSCFFSPQFSLNRVIFTVEETFSPVLPCSSAFVFHSQISFHCHRSPEKRSFSIVEAKCFFWVFFQLFWRSYDRIICFLLPVTNTTYYLWCVFWIQWWKTSTETNVRSFAFSTLLKIYIYMFAG